MLFMYSRLLSRVKTHDARRGLHLTTADVGFILSTLWTQVIQEPFQCELGQAVQWFDIFQIEVERQTEAAVQICRE
jgi:hypothetical protein